MIEVVNLNIDPFDSNDFVLYWEISNPRGKDLSNYKYRVLRSQDRDGKFTRCAGWKDFSSETFFRDRKTSKLSRWIELFYKIEVKDLSNDKVEPFGPVGLEKGATTLDCMIIRNQRNLLASRGRDIIIFKKPADGVRCICYNEILGDFDVPNCSSCGGTGYVEKNNGIFFSKMFFPQESRQTTNQEGDEQTLFTGVWLSNFPIISKGDMIVDKRNDRYVVNQITVYNPRDVIIRQELQISEIKKTSTLMGMPVPEDFKKL